MYSRICSMYGIFTYRFTIPLSQMQVNISYMEHLRKVIFVTDGGTHGKSPFGISQTMNISVQKM